jgi:hypothetical protein
VLRTDLRSGFEFGGITWENYRGRVGSTDFFPTLQAYVVPEGTSIFSTEVRAGGLHRAVNTLGLPLYAKMVSDPSGLNRFVKLHTQSNPLALCTAPARGRQGHAPDVIESEPWTSPLIRSSKRSLSRRW